MMGEGPTGIGAPSGTIRFSSPLGERLFPR